MNGHRLGVGNVQVKMRTELMQDNEKLKLRERE